MPSTTPVNSVHQDFFVLWQKHITPNELKWYCYRLLQDQVETELACIRIENRARQGYIKAQAEGIPILKFRAWVYTIARNEALRSAQYLKNHQLRGLLPDQEPIKDSSDPTSDTDSNAIPPLLTDAFQYGVISQQEYDVIRYDLSGQFKDRQRLSEFLGMTRGNCDVIYLRGIRKMVLAIFTTFIRYLGGPAAVEAIFQQTLLNPPPFFTPQEETAFVQIVIKRNTKYKPLGNALQAACQKMIEVPEIRENFLY